MYQVLFNDHGDGVEVSVLLLTTNELGVLINVLEAKLIDLSMDEKGNKIPVVGIKRNMFDAIRDMLIRLKQ